MGCPMLEWLYGNEAGPNNRDFRRRFPGRRRSDLDPDRVSGAPCFAKTRVPIQNLFDYLESGAPLEEFLTGFPPITRDQAIKVLEQARTGLFDSLPRSENLTRP